ncbi:MAG: hypothetical protein SV760_00805, partial [Halobacteria archaeon]|nr:hypothetical protein [Halobacteria archaeon]
NTHYVPDEKLYRLQERDGVTDLDLLRTLVNSARAEFVNWSFQTARFDLRDDRIVEDGDRVVLEITTAEHENVPRILEEVFEARFDVDVEREANELRVDPSDLDVPEVER